MIVVIVVNVFLFFMLLSSSVVDAAPDKDDDIFWEFTEGWLLQQLLILLRDNVDVDVVVLFVIGCWSLLFLLKLKSTFFVKANGSHGM